ncbi:hypothetical protein M072_3687 [Bacteroides fragilis str. DS-208]|nr:hypothetical protein M072_3687 [Bacteroides fragilis str. DS-208]
MLLKSPAPILALIATIPFGPALILFWADTPFFLYSLHFQSFFPFCFSSSYNLI